MQAALDATSWCQFFKGSATSQLHKTTTIVLSTGYRRVPEWFKRDTSSRRGSFVRSIDRANITFETSGSPHSLRRSNCTGRTRPRRRPRRTYLARARTNDLIALAITRSDRTLIARTHFRPRQINLGQCSLSTGRRPQCLQVGKPVGPGRGAPHPPSVNSFQA